MYSQEILLHKYFVGELPFLFSSPLVSYSNDVASVVVVR
jgi:hypothetical protein